jgi:hypothetical protein
MGWINGGRGEWDLDSDRVGDILRVSEQKAKHVRRRACPPRITPQRQKAGRHSAVRRAVAAGGGPRGDGDRVARRAAWRRPAARASVGNRRRALHRSDVDPVRRDGRGSVARRNRRARRYVRSIRPRIGCGSGRRSVLQAGNFGIVALDLADVAAPALRGFPFTTWMRIARVVEGSETVALLVGSDRIARSPGGATILPGNGGRSTAVWAGASSRARVLRGLRIEARVVTGR